MRSIYTLGFGLILAIAGVNTAPAAPIAPTDYDTVVGTFGALVAGPSIDFFDAAGPMQNTSLENTVFFDDSVYTYVHTVTPSVNFVSEFNTAFDVLGFNGVAGWSFSDSLAAGGLGLGLGFEVDLDLDGTLDWETAGQLSGDLVLNPNGWGTGEAITFFFQSTLPPGTGTYNLINSETGSATSFAPQVPEPGTLLLLGGALMMLAVGRRRRIL